MSGAVLAIDSSARRRLTLVRATPAGQLVAAVEEMAAPTVRGLDRAVARLLAGGGLIAVVVVTGPGSYTGLRAGMAAGLGLAHAGALPLHGLGSLEVAARAAPGAAEEAGLDLVALADAGRGGAYAARFSRGEGGLRPRGDPWRASLEDLRGGGLGAGVLAVSLDAIDLPGVLRGDPAAALAAAVPGALARPALAPAALRGVYLG
jgi:tRNA threonylcarbamoyladenosine biosynthesis protein TsaB